MISGFGALDHVRELARLRLLRIDRLPAVHQLRAPFVDDAFDVAHPDVVRLGAEHDQQIEAGERRRARAGGDDLHLPDLLAGQIERVLYRRADDDGGAVLVVMEHRNFHPALQLILDVEAFRRLEVFQIDAAEGRLERCNHRDDMIDVMRLDLDVEHVDAGELLEQDRLALHDGLASQRPDIAKPEHCRAV